MHFRQRGVHFLIIGLIYTFVLKLLYLPANRQFSGLHEPAVDATLLHKLVVGATLDDHAVIDHQNLVRMMDSFQPMSNHKDGFLFGQGFDGRGQFLFAFRVNIGGCFVQNDDGGIFSAWHGQ